MPQEAARVLDVGQCTPDHTLIRRTLTDHFDVQLDRAATVPQALSAMREKEYRLVLVNRVIDEDRSDGMLLIREAKGDERLRDVPVMLVSNYQDAQATAVRLGAVRGFGKSQVRSASTIKLLAAHLPRKS